MYKCLGDYEKSRLLCELKKIHISKKLSLNKEKLHQIIKISNYINKNQLIKFQDLILTKGTLSILYDCIEVNTSYFNFDTVRNFNFILLINEIMDVSVNFKSISISKSFFDEDFDIGFISGLFNKFELFDLEDFKMYTNSFIDYNSISILEEIMPNNLFYDCLEYVNSDEFCDGEITSIMYVPCNHIIDKDKILSLYTSIDNFELSIESDMNNLLYEDYSWHYAESYFSKNKDGFFIIFNDYTILDNYSFKKKLILLYGKLRGIYV